MGISIVSTAENNKDYKRDHPSKVFSVGLNTQHRYVFLPPKDGEALYSQQKQDHDLTVAQIMNSLLPNSELN